MPNSTPAACPAASVPSRSENDTPRQRAQIARSTNAPIERTVAWMNGGISGSASFTETWLRPHSVSASMISARRRRADGVLLFNAAATGVVL